MTPDDGTGLLRERLAAATGHLSPAPDVAARAAAGGRRRLRRRRAVEGLATTVVALAAVVAVALPPALRDAVPPPPADRTTAPTDDWSAAPPEGVDVLRWLYDRPARGDLAGDTAYVGRVIDVWNRSHAASANAFRGIFRDLRGAARVVWAGRTPAGPAAVVVQQAVFHEHPDGGVRPGPGTVVGFVGVGADGRPRLVADGYRDARAEPVPSAWFVDPAGTVAAVLDLGVPIGSAQGWRYQPDGVRDLDWTPLTFRDGVAVVRVDGGRWWDLRVARPPYRDVSDLVLVGLDRGPAPRGTKLRWQRAGGPHELPIAGLSPTRLDDPGRTFDAALEERLRGLPFADGHPLWNAAGRLPDGTEVVVADTRLDADPSHSYAVLVRDGTTRVVHGGPVDPDAPLPVVVPLPDGLGTVVAHDRARLESWSASGWRHLGAGAALVPAGTTQVRVTPPGAAPVVVQVVQPAARG